MGERDKRAEKIRADAGGHAVVRFAVSSLLATDAGFAPRPTMATALEEKLRALGPTDGLVAAVLGLVDLAYVLRKQSSSDAADAICAALSHAQQLVDDALSTLPPDEETLAAIRAARFDAVRGTAIKVEGRQPTANEVAADLLARRTRSQAVVKKEKP